MRVLKDKKCFRCGWTHGKNVALIGGDRSSHCPGQVDGIKWRLRLWKYQRRKQKEIRILRIANLRGLSIYDNGKGSITLRKPKND